MTGLCIVLLRYRDVPTTTRMESMRPTVLRRIAATGVRVALPRPTPYCIVARGRCGSNLLCSLLRSHPKVRDAGEAIGDWAFAQEGSALRRHLLEHGSVAYVEALFRRRRYESASGFKVLYEQLEPAYAERQGVPDLPDVLEFLRSKRMVRIIHLKRRNRLETLVSKEVAFAVREHVLLHGDGAANDVTIQLSPEQCEEEFRRIGAWEERYDEIFHRHVLLQLSYEDLASDMDHESLRVQEFLGVSSRPLHTRMRKQIRKPMAQVIENYAELRKEFVDTPWASYFDSTPPLA
ncbi:MAG: sulfotransferase [Acidimicrobiia bacterium]